MKKFFFILLISGLFGCSEKPDHSKRIPESSSAVVSVNLPAISKKMLVDKLTSFDFFGGQEFLPKAVHDSTRFPELSKFLSKPTEFGADLMTRIYACRINDEENHFWAVIFLTDDKSLESGIKTHFSTDAAEDVSGFSYYALDKQNLLAWQKGEALIIIPEGSVPVDQQLKLLAQFQAGKDKKLPEDIRKSVQSESDISIWMNQLPAATGLPEGIVSSEIYFENGKLKLKNEVILPGYQDYLDMLVKNKNDEVFSGNLPLYCSFFLNVPKFKSVDSTAAMFGGNNFSPTMLAMAFSGRGAACISGSRIIEKEFVSLELDENYELVEQKTISKDTVINWTVALEVKEEAAAEGNLLALANQGLIQKTAEGYATLFPPDGKILLQDKLLLITNSPDSSDVTTFRKLVYSGSPLTLKGDFTSLQTAVAGLAPLTALQSAYVQEGQLDGLKGFSFTVDEIQKEKFTSTFIIDFADQSRNSLAQLADVLRKLNQEEKLQ